MSPVLAPKRGDLFANSSAPGRRSKESMRECRCGQALVGDMPPMTKISAIAMEHGDARRSLYHINGSGIQNIVICGSFRFSDEKSIFKNLDEIKYKYGAFRIIRAAEDRIGKIVNKWARENDIEMIAERASWFRYGTAAKVLRDEHILNYYSPVLVVCFVTLKEYPNLYGKAKRDGIDILEFCTS
ncbi:SLOG family protein [Labrys sp. WJW]|uniref:SLOG family protein n=1 Tax=Labrys sp. WJW TaxID=1737983 RepID=UPI0009EDE72E|nr:SLOG family protein [Labrys sp. WJW]